MVTVKMVGGDKAQARIRALTLVYTDLTEPFKLLGAYVRSEFQSIFDKQGDPEAFEPLSRTYAKWKQSKVGNKPIMQLTGTLLNAFTIVGYKGSSSELNEQAGEVENVTVIGARTARFGARSPYVYSQFKAGRKILQWTDARRDKSLAVMSSWFFKKADTIFKK